MEAIKDLVNAIEDGKSVDIESAFETAMAEKVSAKLDDMRADYAKNMFAAQEETVEVETESEEAE